MAEAQLITGIGLGVETRLVTARVQLFYEVAGVLPGVVLLA